MLVTVFGKLMMILPLKNRGYLLIMFMKRLLFVLMAALLVLPMSAQEHGTETRCSFLDKCLFEVGVSVGMENKGYTPLMMNANLGYNFGSRFYGFVKAEGVLGLYDKDGVKTYTKSPSFGGGLGFRLTNPKNSSDNFDIRASVTNSIGNADWKHTAYKVNVIWYGNVSTRKTSPYLGIGFKHVKSHTAGIPNYNGIYAIVGVCF